MTSLVLDRVEASVPAARAFIRHQLHTRGEAASTVDDAELLISELVDNAVRHTHGPYIAVHLTCHDDHLQCLVLDADPTPPHPRCGQTPPAEEDPAADLSSPPSESTEPMKLTEHGRGLHLVAALATRWGSHPDARAGWNRKAVWFQLATSEHPPALHAGDPAALAETPPLPVRPPRSTPGCQIRVEDDPVILRRVLDGLRCGA